MTTGATATTPPREGRAFDIGHRAVVAAPDEPAGGHEQAPAVHAPRRRRGPGILLDALFVRGGKLALLVFLSVGLLLPLASILSRALDADGPQLERLLDGTHFFWLLRNSLNVSFATVLVVIPLAYLYAYALQRTRLIGRRVWRGVSLLPLMAPSMFPAIALIYLFGNQGLLRTWFPDGIYGFWGILLGQIFYNFPMAVMILVSALSMADARLYDAAAAMGARHGRMFFTVTWPSTRYAVFTASCLVFTQTITNFGIPVVIGGDYQVLAMEAYKAVVGQQQFSYGALIGTLLLIPAILSFIVDRWMRRLQGSHMTSRASVYHVGRNRVRDSLFFVVVAAVSVTFLAIVTVAAVGSLINFWPYSMNFTLRHYDFTTSGDVGWLAYGNSITLSFLAALIGTPVVFTCAYLMERSGGQGGFIEPLLRFLCLLPMAVPGLVMGLGYVFFFNHPANPLNLLYGSMALMVMCCIVRFLTPAQMTATAALRQLSRDIEPASLSLRVPLVRTYWRVVLPICLPTVLEIFRYLFVSSMTSVSALIFLYSPDTILAAVAVLNMDDAGNLAGAAALSTLILLTSVGVSLLLSFVVSGLLRRTQAWRG
ncbi:putative 2-aminoethylphosphonate ABC transporter permease subunit [Verticiella sediminum]|uniref:Putative 2-aminoethylphosphonate ABC transporter permease subunit n=1 Tax=Verticiella sediminum TaxID=1247510 RepID=A0A556B1B9_9BURK|nr:putative 2-aminoethylphosphonate ABC transporter permease subunit [Verticiella sediminum]TSH98944.1 putative 2-aminoethylphosphonate ABC transporter permease subunit [Verticiella sediminum]